MICALPAMAQQTKVNSSGGTSPHETTGAVIDGNRITITYGRPFTRSPCRHAAQNLGQPGALRPPWRMGWTRPPPSLFKSRS